MTKSAVKFTKGQIQALRQVAKDSNLRGRQVLDEYSDDEIAESFNGAGASSAGELQRRILTRILRRRLADVMIHDMQYRKGGTVEDFHRANRDLEYNISRARGGSRDTVSGAWWDFVGKKAREYSDRNGMSGWGKV